jgi:hypothetical protein
METEPPILPAGEVTLYHLTGEWGLDERFMSPRTVTLPRFHEVPVLSSVLLTDDLAASLRRTLGRRETYQGEPDRCFIPRHGLRFGSESDADALICLECHLAFFRLNNKEVSYALSPVAVNVLTTLFRSAEPASRGLNPAQILHQASFHSPSVQVQ